jgi:type I restriction enzyme R subunit
MEISEKDFESSIESHLLTSGYLKRHSDYYDNALCLDNQMVVDFILALQPEEWEKLQQQHGLDTKKKFLARVAGEIKKRGALDVLRKGVKD